MNLRLLANEEAQNYKDIIATYHPSGQTVFDFARSSFAVIAGPTGAGKDTLRNALMQRSSNFTSVLSTTSRPPRPGEQDGVQYHFKSLDFFEQGIDEQRFLQVALVHNQQLSCLDIEEIQKLDPSQVGLSILIVQTEIELRALNANLRTVFVVPPDLETLLRRMQIGRDVAEDEIKRRMEAAKIELQIAHRQPDYYCIVNDNIAQMTELAQNFLMTGVRDENTEKRGRQAIEEVLFQLEKA